MEENNVVKMLSESLQKINVIVDSSKVIGTPFHIDENRMLIPISKVSFAFGSGGSEFASKKQKVIQNEVMYDNDFPFGGGTLGGVNISPIAFLLIDKESSSLIRVEPSDSLFDKLLDIALKFMKTNAKKTKE